MTEVVDPRYERQAPPPRDARITKTRGLRPRGEAAKERRTWEEAHPDRMESVLFDDPKYTPAQRLRAAGIGPSSQNQQTHSWVEDGQGRKHLQTAVQQRLDLTDPDSGRPLYDKSAVPPAWESLPPEIRQNTERRMRLQYGITKESAKGAFGAQISQAAVEAEQEGLSTMKGGDWYRTGGEGVSAVAERAKVMNETGWYDVTHEEMALAHGPTSRNTAFIDERGAYQNTDAAEVAVAMASGERDDDDPTLFTGGRSPTDPMNLISEGEDRRTETGYKRRITSPAIPAGAEAVERHRAGETFGEAMTTKSSRTGGPPRKVGAYVSALADPEGPEKFTVTDVHTSAGFAPHLPKKQRELMLNAASVTFRPHEFLDRVNREIAADLGGTMDVDELQAVQWRQQRGYEAQQATQEAGQVIGQRDIFGGEVEPPPPPELSLSEKIDEAMPWRREMSHGWEQPYHGPVPPDRPRGNTPL